MPPAHALAAQGPRSSPRAISDAVTRPPLLAAAAATPRPQPQRDPAIWPDAAAFAPERLLPADHAWARPELAPSDAGALTPFGVGARACIGSRFALMEAKLALAILYQRLIFRLTAGQVPLRTRMGLTLAPAGGGIFVTVHKRVGKAAADGA